MTKLYLKFRQSAWSPTEEPNTCLTSHVMGGIISSDVIGLRRYLKHLCHVIQKGSACQAETAAENTHAVQPDDVAQPHS